MAAGSSTCWGALRRGDRIICPITHKVESVLRSRHQGPGLWFVHTERHDHIRSSNERVTLVGGGA